MSKISLNTLLIIFLVLSAIWLVVLTSWINTPSVAVATDPEDLLGSEKLSLTAKKPRAEIDTRAKAPAVKKVTTGTKPADGDWASPKTGLEQFAEAADIDVNQAAQMKADYFCDLAVKTRERCESIPRSPEQMEFCLKASGYYTNSRHCGHQP